MFGGLRKRLHIILRHRGDRSEQPSLDSENSTARFDMLQAKKRSKQALNALARPDLPAKLSHGSDLSQSRGRPGINGTLDAVRLNEHIEFVRRTFVDHQLDEEQNASIFDIMERIQERMADPRFCLGIVGEFSSGKSTLINALIRDNLLRTDILQGITSAATTLSYGDKLAVNIRYR